MVRYDKIDGFLCLTPKTMEQQNQTNQPFMKFKTEHNSNFLRLKTEYVGEAKKTDVFRRFSSTKTGNTANFRTLANDF